MKFNSESGKERVVFSYSNIRNVSLIFKALV